MKKEYRICLDVGGTKVLGAVYDRERNAVCRLKKKSDELGTEAENVEQVIVSVVEELLDASGLSLEQVSAIASSIPGVIDQKAGVVLFTPNLPWRDYDIRSTMVSRFGVPFFIGNDVNLGVLGEYRFGAARGFRNVVGLFVGTGVGGGLILNGELYTGNKFKAGELGHMIVEPEGPLCACGQRGGLEAFSSKQGMSAYIRQQISRGRDSLLAEAVQAGVFKSKKLKKALLAGDEVAMEAVDRACHYLAVATGSLINIFSPDLVLYGGGVMEAVGDLMLEKILREADRYCMPEIRSTVELKTAALGDDSVLSGALALIEEQS